MCIGLNSDCLSCLFLAVSGREAQEIRCRVSKVRVSLGCFRTCLYLLDPHASIESTVTIYSIQAELVKATADVAVLEEKAGRFTQKIMKTKKMTEKQTALMVRCSVVATLLVHICLLRDPS